VIDGREKTLEDLRVGDTFNMEVQRQADGPPRAMRIETTGMEPMGVVESMTDRSVTIHSDPRGKNVVESFVLDDTVAVSIDGKS